MGAAGGWGGGLKGGEITGAKPFSPPTQEFVNVERIFARNTRQGNRYNFRVENDQSSKYKNSQYFKGSGLWDNLPNDVISIPTLATFKDKLKRFFSPFDEILS